MANVLVTGGGHVGAAVGKLFTDKGYNVIFYDVEEVPFAARADFIIAAKLRDEIKSYQSKLETLNSETS